MRIVNLSRVAARPLGAKLMLSELAEAVAMEPFASWLPLGELRDVLKAGGSRLVSVAGHVS